jgi:hypothetical protein
MKYTKPEILLDESALVLIQGQGKPNNFNLDSDNKYDCIVPAYEADE